MLQQLHNIICSEILAKIPEIQTCGSYPRTRSELVAPACFVELEAFDIGSDPGTEELALIANFNARIVADRVESNTDILIRELALKLAILINNNTWNCNVLPAKIKSVEPDAFSPEMDAYLVWNISWIHEFHIGENIWESNEIPPHKVIVNGGIL